MDECQHLRELMDERDRRYEQRHLASQVAVDAAVVSINERLGLLNELRGDVATKAELKALEKIVQEMSKRMDVKDGRGAGLNAVWVYMLAGLGAFGTIISVYLALRS